jgi:hypothetical protein
LRRRNLKAAESKTLADPPSISGVDEDVGEPSKHLPTRFPDTSGDPVEAALAEGVRALAEAMRRAMPDQLAGLAERMGELAGELKARRLTR